MIGFGRFDGLNAGCSNRQGEECFQPIGRAGVCLRGSPNAMVRYRVSHAGTWIPRNSPCSGSQKYFGCPASAQAACNRWGNLPHRVTYVPPEATSMHLAKYGPQHGLSLGFVKLSRSGHSCIKSLRTTFPRPSQRSDLTGLAMTAIVTIIDWPD